jgi:large conductance mechanosensitive channel
LIYLFSRKEEKMKKVWQDFKAFIKRGNVVDMAIGVAVASAFTAIVTAFTKGFITPLLALITNQSTLDDMKIILRPETVELVDGVETVVDAEIAILWGPFIHSILDFLIIAVVFFLVLRIVSRFRMHYAKVKENVVNMLTDADERAAEEALKKQADEEEAARLAREAEAETVRLENEKTEAEKARLERQEALLTEIRDLLKWQSGQ